jgi:hypothetical protein
MATANRLTASADVVLLAAAGLTVGVNDTAEAA